MCKHCTAFSARPGVTRPAPDYADGGMAAAAIEKEIEDRPSNPLAAYWLRECDRRDADAKRWKEATRRAIQARAGLRHELVLANERAEKHRRAEVDHSTNARCWMKTSEEWQATAEEWEKRALAAESRPLTPDAITDEMVERAFNLADRIEAVVINKTIMRDALIAALTEPPARPEGLTRLIDTILEATYDPEPVATGEALYNAGVRVVTEEQP